MATTQSDFDRDEFRAEIADMTVDQLDRLRDYYDDLHGQAHDVRRGMGGRRTDTTWDDLMRVTLRKMLVIDDLKFEREDADAEAEVAE